MKHKIFTAILFVVLLGFQVQAEPDGHAEEKKLKYYLMIGDAQPEVWKAIVEAGGKDISKPGREATEALGGKIIGYYLGATEAKNYIIVAYPSSVDVTKIVYMRAAQGVMKNLEFIEIIPADDMSPVFESIKAIQKK